MLDQTAQELEVEDQELENEAVIEYDIASYPSDFTLDNLYSQWGKNSIVIPDFQREYVWSIRQASLLIDSFMMGLPVPPVFLYLGEDNKYLVIDGQQRLLSVFFFFEGYFGQSSHGKRKVFKLEGLDESIRYANKTFAEFTDDDRRKLEGSVLRAINIRQINPMDHNTSAYHIFERLNTGGTPLKPQEIRNCVFAGDFVPILKELNLDDSWRQIIGKPTLDKYQKDVELVLRLFAFADAGAASYESPMKEFLNRSMEKNRAGNSPNAVEFKRRFPIVCRYIVDIFGAKPFHVRGPINTAYLDSVFCAVYNHYDSMPDDAEDRYRKLKAAEDFNDSHTRSGTQDTNTLKLRHAIVERMLTAEAQEDEG